jgi:hypothetical protein
MDCFYDKVMRAFAPALPGARKLVRDHGVEAVKEVERIVAAGRVRPEAISDLYSALLIAQVEAAVERAAGSISTSALWDDLAIYRNLERMPDDQDANCELEQAIHVVAFARAGRPVYEVSPGLAVQLLHTELRGLSAEDLRLPHPSLVLLVPPEAGLRSTTADTGEKAILSASGVRTLGVTEVVLREDRGPKPAWSVLIRCGVSDPFGGGVFRLELPPGRSLEDCLSSGGGAHWQEGVGVFRWAMNSVMYAGSQELRTEVWGNPAAVAMKERFDRAPPGRTRERLREDLRRVDKQRRIVLGPDVPLEAAESGAGATLTVRVRVQGHWKRQPCGEGRQDRKVIWVQPHWRGPEDGPQRDAGRHLLAGPRNRGRGFGFSR